MYDKITSLQDIVSVEVYVKHLLNKAYDSEQLRFEGFSLQIGSPSEDGRSNTRGGASLSGWWWRVEDILLLWRAVRSTIVLYRWSMLMMRRNFWVRVLIIQMFGGLIYWGSNTLPLLLFAAELHALDIISMPCSQWNAATQYQNSANSW